MKEKETDTAPATPAPEEELPKMAPGAPVPYEQRTAGWHRARLGKITGSRIAVIFGKARGGGEDSFSQTAVAYLRERAGEELIAPAIIDDETSLLQLMDMLHPQTRAMKQGVEWEPVARDTYAQTHLSPHSVVVETSLWMSGEDTFGSSPDGLVLNEQAGDAEGQYSSLEGVIEIKCPDLNGYIRLCACADGAALLKEDANYYWQCVAHMAVTGAQWCDFCVYNPFMAVPLHVMRIERNEAEVHRLCRRAKVACDYIQSLKDGELKPLYEAAEEEWNKYNQTYPVEQ